MAGKTFSGAALEKALREKTLAQPGIELTGMVKASEQEDSIQFTRSGCENWVEIPTEMIEQAEVLGQQPCKDHSHPLVKLTLKEVDNDAARLFAALLAQSKPSPPPLMPPMPPPGLGPFPQYPQFPQFPQMPGSLARLGGGGGFGGIGGVGGVGNAGTFDGGGLGFWGCGTLCGIAYAACLAGCTGAGPFAIPCGAACSGLYKACSDGC